ncbi:MAG: hypothetical protein A2365_03840 [Candidatus Nealsonbacteria bacterium RIFOXYB1_FULL_40_15]|nr:MAG: hypothetical protein A2365_03840 [Candidatus Nealsonbacteria bacterium RIFOXYB1_FULL_40_15]OGZ29556.1 MAG: hypothetical protein A2562_02610 [Candidatus Nealsonbacteria bacterium RIFOXYD1_FULL_39_11]
MKKYLILVLAIILFSFIFVFQGIYLPQNASSKEEEPFLVRRGESLSRVAENLEERGLIKNKMFFILYAVIMGKSENIKAGEYAVSSSMAVPEILNKFSLGERIKKTITVIEGWNLRDISEHLKEKGIEGEIDPGLEGYLFPDTYEISPEDGLEDIVLKMQSNFNSKFSEEMKKDAKRPLSEIVIMASLLEKEVRTLEDKKLVSGLLWKRIEAGMRLQVDATVCYATGRKSSQLTKEELAIDSPYNTYKYKGLPPGPICSPGLESILAAVYPEDSDYWFYLSTPEGETIFSKNFSEHEKARRAYLK